MCTHLCLKTKQFYQKLTSLSVYFVIFLKPKVCILNELKSTAVALAMLFLVVILEANF